MSGPGVRRAAAGVAILLGLALTVSQTAVANVKIVKVSSDPYTNTTSYHKTELEPDTFSFGKTIVGVFQTGRFSNGGSSNIGWATSTDAGATWHHGFLPKTTVYANPPGPWDRISDPSIAYDPKHDVWIANTLSLTGATGIAVLASRSTDGGLTWGNPITIAIKQGGFLDKNWIGCDTTSSSPFYGNCYVEYDDASSGNALHLAYSTDGGQTWKASSAPGTCVIGGQPVVQPNGNVVVPIDDCFEGDILSYVSKNGGGSYQGPYTAASISYGGSNGNLRTSPLPSAEVDGAGKVYVVWEDCRFESGCATNDIVMTTSTDGQSWTSVKRIPIDPTNSGVDHVIPGLAVDRNTQGNSAHIGLAYYFFPQDNCGSSCKLDVGFISSTDGGSSWTNATQLAGPMNMGSLPLTNQGYMVGDYMSTSFAGGKAFPIFAKAKNGTTCTLGQIKSCFEKMVAPLNGLVSTGPRTPVRNDRVVAPGYHAQPSGTRHTAF
jgi:hypothetical protein